MRTYGLFCNHKKLFYSGFCIDAVTKVSRKRYRRDSFNQGKCCRALHIQCFFENSYRDIHIVTLLRHICRQIRNIAYVHIRLCMHPKWRFLLLIDRSEKYFRSVKQECLPVKITSDHNLNYIEKRKFAFPSTFEKICCHIDMRLGCNATLTFKMKLKKFALRCLLDQAFNQAAIDTVEQSKIKKHDA